MTAIHTGAASGGIMAGLDDRYEDPRDLFRLEGEILGARAEDLARNNPIAAAIVETIIDNVCGTDGMEFTSTYQADADPEVSDDDIRAQDAITSWVRRAMGKCRWDAAGLRSTRDLLADLLWCAILPGTGVSIRTWKPQRIGNPLTGWCARVIHPSRLVNPDRRPNSASLANGFELDADGDPVAAHIVTHRMQLSGEPDRWTRMPLVGADGQRNVHLLTIGHHPEQIQGFGFLTPILDLVKVHGGTIRAYVVAKQIQASFPIVVETDDPKMIAQAVRLGVYLGPECANRIKLRPNQILIARKGTTHTFTDLKFNGADMAAFNDGLLELACAAIGFPPDVALKRLTKSSLASARAALADAWRFVQLTRRRLIDYVLEPWVCLAIAEGLARGEIAGVASDDMDRLSAGIYEGTAMPDPDPYKSAARAGILLHDVRMSPSTVYRGLSADFRREMIRAAADARLAERYGVSLEKATGPAAATAAADEPVTAPADAPDESPADEPALTGDEAGDTDGEEATP